MAIYNTSSDAANTAVRAFLTKVGELYLGRSFNTSSGFGKQTWLRIKNEVFNGRCAYCDSKSVSLQIEHLVMFNRSEYGLHHPGNIVPCCKECNKRTKDSNGNYLTWREHLKIICKQKSDFKERESKIDESIKSENYPCLNEKEQHAIRVIANTLYENIKNESNKSLSLYKELDEVFVKQG
jgi:hypothetical protein